MVALREEIVDGTGQTVAKRFGYVEMWRMAVRGPASRRSSTTRRLRRRSGRYSDVPTQPWLAAATRTAETWATSVDLPTWYAEVSARRRRSLPGPGTLSAIDLDRRSRTGRGRLHGWMPFPSRRAGGEIRCGSKYRRFRSSSSASTGGWVSWTHSSTPSATPGRGRRRAGCAAGPPRLTCRPARESGDADG